MLFMVSGAWVPSFKTHRTFWQPQSPACRSDGARVACLKRSVRKWGEVPPLSLISILAFGLGGFSMRPDKIARCGGSGQVVRLFPGYLEPSLRKSTQIWERKT